MKTALIILVLLPIVIKAEIVKDKATVWDDHKETPLLLLEDSVKVIVDPIIGHWYRMSIYIFVSEKDFFEDEMIIRKGATLYDSVGNRVGIALNDIEVRYFDTNNGIIETLISAVQIQQENIYPDSDIEFQFSNLLLSNASNINDFQNHFKFNGYFAWIASTTFKSFIVYGALTEPPVIRILAVFEADKLFCVIHYSHNNYPTCISRSSIREFQVSYFSENKNRIKEFEDIYFPIIQRSD